MKTAAKTKEVKQSYWYWIRRGIMIFWTIIMLTTSIYTYYIENDKVFYIGLIGAILGLIMLTQERIDKLEKLVKK